GGAFNDPVAPQRPIASLRDTSVLRLVHLPIPVTAFFLSTDPATTQLYTLSLHDALPISSSSAARISAGTSFTTLRPAIECPTARSEEHTSELQSLRHLVCRLLLEKKKISIS